MLKLKLQYFGHLMWRVDSSEKNSDAGRVWGQEEKGTTEDETARWHHWLDGHEPEWTPGVGDGQGGLACCDSWGRKESDTTERLNWTELNESMAECVAREWMKMFQFKTKILFLPFWFFLFSFWHLKSSLCYCFPFGHTFWVFLYLHFHCSVQSLSHVQLLATPWTAARQASLSITNSRSSLKPMSIESVMPSNHLILCRPLLLLPTIPPRIRVFSNESTLLTRWPKYWSFSFSISPSNEGSPCSPRDSQESSSTPQFRSINFSALSFLYGSTLTSTHNYWKNHSFDYRDLCQQSNFHCTTSQIF